MVKIMRSIVFSNEWPFTDGTLEQKFVHFLLTSASDKLFVLTTVR